jgi:hypothetical protein
VGTKATIQAAHLVRAATRATTPADLLVPVVISHAQAGINQGPVVVLAVPVVSDPRVGLVVDLVSAETPDLDKEGNLDPHPMISIP